MFRPKPQPQSVSDEIVPKMTLGNSELEMNEQGEWILQQDDSKAQQEMTRMQNEIARWKQEYERVRHELTKSHGEIVARDNRIAELEGNKSSRPASQDTSALEDTIVNLKDRISELKFRNNVLLAMVTISEGDYLNLCNEADIQPRAVHYGFRVSDKLPPTRPDGSKPG